MLIKISLFFGSALLATACSTSSQTAVPSSAATAVANISPASLYQAFSSIPAPQAAATFASLQKLSVPDYFAYKANLAGNTTFAIDGHAVVRDFTSAAAKANVATLAAQFPTIGSYWHSIGIDNAAISETTFMAGINAIIGSGQKSLGLADTFTESAWCGDSSNPSAETIKDTTGAEVATVVTAANTVADKANADSNHHQKSIGRGYTVEAYGPVSSSDDIFVSHKNTTGATNDPTTGPLEDAVRKCLTSGTPIDADQSSRVNTGN